jgi:hypothetical protein
MIHVETHHVNLLGMSRLDKKKPPVIDVITGGPAGVAWAGVPTL